VSDPVGELVLVVVPGRERRGQLFSDFLDDLDDPGAGSILPNHSRNRPDLGLPCLDSEAFADSSVGEDMCLVLELGQEDQQSTKVPGLGDAVIQHGLLRAISHCRDSHGSRQEQAQQPGPSGDPADHGRSKPPPENSMGQRSTQQPDLIGRRDDQEYETKLELSRAS
jgi:hypothetical protein